MRSHNDGTEYDTRVATEIALRIIATAKARLRVRLTPADSSKSPSRAEEHAEPNPHPDEDDRQQHNHRRKFVAHPNHFRIRPLEVFFDMSLRNAGADEHAIKRPATIAATSSDQRPSGDAMDDAPKQILHQAG